MNETSRSHEEIYALYDRIKHILAVVIKVGCSEMFHSSQGFFQLISSDFIISQEFQPYLIGMDKVVNFSRIEGVIRDVHKQVIKDVSKLLRIIIAI